MWMGGNESISALTFTTSRESCEEFYSDFNYSQFGGDIFCNATWDNYLCWPPTKPNSKIILPCPPLKGVNAAEFAFRVCGFNGGWHSNDGTENGDGWTNYTKCFIPEIRELINKLYSNSEEDGKRKLEVANTGRVLETVGLSISLAAILISLIIFSSFRSLRNNRTRIHWHLFVAMKIQLVIRLVLYIDQYVTRHNVNDRNGIDNTPILCEGFYVLLEYARTAMFLWMFIEGLYLHNMVTVSVFQDKPNYRIYYVIGWGLPLIMTSIWAGVMAQKYTHTECWWGYNLSSYFWILEGPRLTVIFTNLLFLLNILRVLITKLKATASSESRQMRKAVRAAIVLLPLLGITNSLGMLHSPVDSDFVKFAAWTYGTTFLKAFQGFFVALIYCFLNHEVRTTLRKTWNNYLSRRYIEEHRRHSLASFQLYRTSTGKKFAHMDFNSLSAPQEIEVAAV